MTLRVAVDFGTSSTCVAVSVNGREPEVVVVDGQPLLSSAFYAAPDGTLFVGQEAERQAAVDPSRFEPNPKRRIDEPELLLGNTVIAVREVIRAVLDRAVDEARRVAGGASVDQLVLTHPADWGGTRARVLRQAANGLAEHITLVPEPVAAAVFHVTTLHGRRDSSAQPMEETLAVLDLGGGTVDVSVVRRQRHPAAGSAPEPGQGFHVLATRGDPSFGGADVDQALLRHVGELVSSADPDSWRQLVEGRELSDRRRRRVVGQDVRGAKETLSRHTYTDVPLPPPFPDAHVTRADLERLIAGPLERTAELTAAAIREAGLTPDALTAIFLVGGSSRIPMVARLVHERTGVMPTTLDQPETVVARGALLAVTFVSGSFAKGSGAQAFAPGRPGVPIRDEATDLHVPRPAAVGPESATQRIVRRPVPAPNMPAQARHAPGVPFSPPGTPASGQPALGPAPPRFPVTPPGGVTAAPQPAPSRRPGRMPWLLGGAVVLVAAVVVAAVMLLGNDGAGQAPVAQEKVLAQYDYRFTMPDDWSQVGGAPERREARIAPAGAESGGNNITVQERLLSYNSDTSRDRALGELRADYDNAGSKFSGFNDSASFAGRNVVYYRQQTSNTTVDWYVLFKGTAQVNVGCQYTDDGRERVYGACDQVVRTMTIG